jgi:hypothetical protein
VAGLGQISTGLRPVCFQVYQQNGYDKQCNHHLDYKNAVIMSSIARIVKDASPLLTHMCGQNMETLRPQMIEKIGAKP